MPRRDDERRDDSENGVDPPTVIHNHYSQSKNGNGNGANKLVWAAAGVLALMFLGLLAFVGAKVWEISERMVRVEATQESCQKPPP